MSKLEQRLTEISLGEPNEQKIDELKAKSHEYMNSEEFTKGKSDDGFITVSAADFEAHESVQRAKRSYLIPSLCTAAAFAVVAGTAVLFSLNINNGGLTNPAASGNSDTSYIFSASNLDGESAVTEQAPVTTSIGYSPEDDAPLDDNVISTTAVIESNEPVETIDISETDGFGIVTVPDFTGMTIDDARKLAESVRLTLNAMYIESESPVGVVISCDSTGANVGLYPDVPTEITVKVSLGEIESGELPTEIPEFSNPLDNPTITEDYYVGESSAYVHPEIDFTCDNKDIYAAADGVVVFAGLNGGYGNMIKIRHNSLDSDTVFYTQYTHCSEMNVEVGGIVKRGDIIGTIGSTGIATGEMLGFSILYTDKNEGEDFIFTHDPKYYIDFSQKPFIVHRF